MVCVVRSNTANHTRTVSEIKARTNITYLLDIGIGIGIGKDTLAHTPIQLRSTTGATWHGNMNYLTSLYACPPKQAWSCRLALYVLHTSRKWSHDQMSHVCNKVRAFPRFFSYIFYVYTYCVDSQTMICIVYWIWC